MDVHASQEHLLAIIALIFQDAVIHIYIWIESFAILAYLIFILMEAYATVRKVYWQVAFVYSFMDVLLLIWLVARFNVWLAILKNTLLSIILVYVNANISTNYQARNVWIIAVMDLLWKPNAMMEIVTQEMVVLINVRYNLDSNVLMAQQPQNQNVYSKAPSDWLSKRLIVPQKKI